MKIEIILRKHKQKRKSELSYSEHASFDVILCVLPVLHTDRASDGSNFSGMTCRERREIACHVHS